MTKHALPNRVKSCCIIAYLLFVIFVAIANFEEYSWASLTQPWFHYNMFSTYNAWHRELAAEGTLMDGTHIDLSLKSVFPMPATLIERGMNGGVSRIIKGFREPFRTSAARKLCRFVLGRYHAQPAGSTRELKEVKIYLSSWPLGKRAEAIRGKTLASCS